MFRGLSIAALAGGWTIACAGATHAATMDRSAKALLEDCSQTAGGAYGNCLGYLLGLWDTVTGLELGLDQKTICAPATVTQGDMRTIFVKWTERNSDKLRVDMSVAAYVAFRAAYPCAKKK